MRRVSLFAAVGVFGFMLIVLVAVSSRQQSLQLWAQQPGPHEASVEVVVVPGTSLRALARQLAAAGAVDDEDKLARLAASNEPPLCAIPAGAIAIEAEATPADIVATLQRRCAEGGTRSRR